MEPLLDRHELKRYRTIERSPQARSQLASLFPPHKKCIDQQGEGGLDGHCHRLEEEILGAAAIAIGTDDLRKLEPASSPVQGQGDCDPAALHSRLGGSVSRQFPVNQRESASS